MYDIEFVEQSSPLKQAVLQGNQVEKIGEQLESMRSRQPFVFQVETTNVCNMKCIMCPRPTLMSRKLGHMDQGLFESVIDQIAPHEEEKWTTWQKHVKADRMPGSVAIYEDDFYYNICSRSLTLHGFGEPVFDPYLEKRIDAAKSKDIPTYLSMNPVNIRLSKMEALIDSGLDYLKFSLDGMNNDDQLKYRGRVDQSYAATIDRVVSVLELIEKKNSQTRIVMTKLNFRKDDQSNQDFLDYWKQYDVKSYVKNQHNRWLYEEDDAPLNQSEYMRRYCEYPWASMTLLYDGRVVPCPLDYDGKVVLGDANDQTLEEIWNSDRYHEFRRQHVTGDFPQGHFCKSQCDIPVLHEFL